MCDTLCCLHSYYYSSNYRHHWTNGFRRSVYRWIIWFDQFRLSTIKRLTNILQLTWTRHGHVHSVYGSNYSCPPNFEADSKPKSKINRRDPKPAFSLFQNFDVVKASTFDKWHLATPLARSCQYQLVLSKHSLWFKSYEQFSQIDRWHQKRIADGHTGRL